MNRSLRIVPGRVSVAAADQGQTLYPLPLLDRLVEDEPDQAGSESARRLGPAGLRMRLRNAVLRDLAQLLQTRCPLSAASATDPRLAASVLGYGMPSLGGVPWTSVDREAVAAAVRTAVLRHEPRIAATTLLVRVTGDEPPEGGARRVEIELRGEVALSPIPLALTLRTRLDLDQGCLEPLEPTPAAIEHEVCPAESLTTVKA